MTKLKIRNVLIVADIEGSSGCFDYRGSSFKTPEWAQACVDMTLDVRAVVDRLFNEGVEHITIKDFHRTGYNLMPDLLDARAKVIHGYRRGPVPGLGDPGRAQAVIFLGMHAASGTDGFLAHTLTSRIEQLTVNGKPMAEVELFAASLAPYGIRPVFFSGCPVACEQAAEVVADIAVYPIDKSAAAGRFNTDSWRAGLAAAAVKSLSNDQTTPYQLGGPLRTVVKMRDGEGAARRTAGRWNLTRSGNQIHFSAPDMAALYMQLIRICYLTPLVEKTLPLCLMIYNLWGRIGLSWVRRQVKGFTAELAESAEKNN